MTDVDVVVIGSGPGGLTAALSLAQAGKKVLVCEQHYVPGGYCHSFMLGGYRFSPGVHYIGELHEGGMMRRVYEGLGLSSDLTFLELNPDGFDHIQIGEEKIDVPKGRQAYIDRLSQRFPREREGIAGYLNATAAMARELDELLKIRGARDLVKLPAKAPNTLRWGMRPAKAMMDHFVSDPLLKGFLSAQAGDHGLPMSKVAAPIHAAVMSHYFNGGYYPMGGGFSIPRAYVRALKKAGGEIRLETRVTKILIEGGAAVGVRLGDGTEVRAHSVVSNADPEITFGRLIGREHLGWRLKRKLDRVTYSGSALSLFMATDLDVESAYGMDSGNYWIYEHADVDAVYEEGRTDSIFHVDAPSGQFLTVTSLKDRSKRYKGHHTMESFCFVNYAPFARWADQTQGDRDAAYRALKSELKDKMLRGLERVAPGLADHLTFWDLGTPLSNEFYANATKGALYGTDKTVGQIGPFAFQVRTRFKGLYMCGASTVSHGVAGATISGLEAARAILRCRPESLLKQGGPRLQTLPCDDLSVWPEKLTRKIKRRRDRNADTAAAV